MDYKKVEGHPGLIRDLDSNAVINNDKTAYQNYVALRDQKLTIKLNIIHLRKWKNFVEKPLQILFPGFLKLFMIE